eukprot:TRINITY_DN2158_c0_g2_i2.p1 TRINITY_DN2158_c0_g2~~TRINITY_DN2158_c0_g2_i2.p1  ORF type:complete len:339 (-),score=51.47 TRINITY_DN2158_c0_g2_i2:453-1469(-)
MSLRSSAAPAQPSVTSANMEPKDAPGAHEPEALAFLPLLQKAWRMFRARARLLLTFTLVTTALALLTSQALSALFQRLFDPIMGGAMDAFNQTALMTLAGTDPPPEVKVPSVDTSQLITFGLLSALVLLIRVVVAFSIIPVFVHVVIGDHLGRTPGSLWVAARHFWSQLGTMLATNLLAPLMAIVALIVAAVLLVFSLGGSTQGSMLTGLLLFIVFILPLPASLIAYVHLALALHVSAAEGPRVWGFKALRRSWALSKGSQWTIFLLLWADWFVAALTGPLEMRTESLRAVVGALGACALAALLRAYLGVAWVLVYLSARQRTEPGFWSHHKAALQKY